jgi:hypothetical protein
MNIKVSFWSEAPQFRTACSTFEHKKSGLDCQAAFDRVELQAVTLGSRQSAGHPCRHITYCVGAATRTFGFIPDVLGSSKEVGIRRSIAVDLLLLQRPRRLCSIKLLEVGDAGVLLAGGAGLHEVRNGNSRQEADDGHHDHDFNQGKAPAEAGCIYFHMITFAALLGSNAKNRFALLPTAESH